MNYKCKSREYRKKFVLTFKFIPPTYFDNIQFETFRPLALFMSCASSLVVMIHHDISDLWAKKVQIDKVTRRFSEATYNNNNLFLFM